MAEYGKFGQAAYDQDDREWYFERVATKDYLRQVGNSHTIRAPTTVSAPTREGGTRQIENHIKTIVRSYPELQPASDLLASYERISKATEETATLHDPTKGNLLAVGFISHQADSGSVEAIAYASGPTGSEMRLARLEKQKRTFSNSLLLEVPSTTGEEAVWKGPGVPIQSIEFAPSVPFDDATILAVRLITEILLFQPEISGLNRREVPKIELNLVFRVRINETASLPYAHITFNPWFPRQFAFIDQAGSWAVMEMDEGKVRSIITAYRQDLVDNPENDLRAPIDDGWARILWIAVPTVLIVCNRRKLILFEQESSVSQELPKVATVLDDSIGWNLDIEVVHAHPDYFVLLTTSHIAVYYITQGADGLPNPDRVITTRHFRNAGDLSLRLHICQDDDDTLLFMRSDLDSTVIYYQMNLSDRKRITFSEPMQFASPSMLTATITCSRVIGMHIHSLPQSKRADLHSEMSSVPGKRRSNSRFYFLTTLHQDMSVMQTSYESSYSRVSLTKEPTNHNSVTSVELALLAHANRSQQVLSIFGQQPLAQIAATSGEDWTISYELTTRQLDDVSTSAVVDVVEALEGNLANLNSASAEVRTPHETFQEQLTGEVQVDDFEGTMNALQQFRHGLRRSKERESPGYNFEPSETFGQPHISTVNWPSVLQTEDHFDLGSLHLSIVDDWILPLSDNMPQSVRSVQEQHALHMATEVAFARLVIRQEEPPDNQSVYDQGQKRDFELPVRASSTPGSSRATPSIYFEASSQPLSSARATPSTPGTPSTVTSFDKPLAISHLNQYTTFSKPPPTALPRSLARVLSHWTLGADPAEYDWRNATRRVNRQIEEQEDEELDEKERLRQQKRRERHVRRQQRHEEERRRQEMLNSQAPEIFTESQPTQVSTSLGFSQATGGSQMPASQILPGRHGGRPPPKKKRKSGF